MSLSPEQKEYIKKNKHKFSADKIAKKLKANITDVKSYMGSVQPIKDFKHKRLFLFVTLLLPVLFFIVLEILLRGFSYSGNLDLFISAPAEYSKYMMVNPQIGRRYFFSQKALPGPTNDLFLKKKQQNGYRIFLLGGSTAAGYPYGGNVMFSRILNLRLSETFPDKYIEIVNVSTAAINTYSLLDFVDEVLDHEPNALLIYAGHNEFYGAMGVASAESLGKFRAVVKLLLKLQKYKTFILIRNLIVSVGKFFDRDDNSVVPSATLMERLVAEQTIPYKSSTYELGKRQFYENLREIVSKAQRAGVKVLISELVSNIRDQKPFISVKTKDSPRAEMIFRYAQELERKGKLAEAKQAYIKAKDLDALRFRASEDFNIVIHDVASEFKIPVIPMKQYFEQASANGLVGNEFLLEHLHPNIEGYFLMSKAFFDVILSEGIISSKSDSQSFNLPAGQFLNYTDLDSIYGELRIRILKGGWPFKPKSKVNTAILDNPPRTKVDSLAVKIWSDEKLNLEHGHVQLAEYYEKNKQYMSAFNEYKALMSMTPFNSSPYLRGANMLIKMEKYDQALSILYKSLRIENTLFANKWVGQILLNKNKTEESLEYLERAYIMKSTDLQLLFNLSGAYALSGKYDLANKSLNKLLKMNPTFPGAISLQRQLTRVLGKTKNNENGKQ